jgi:hypothetical protein
VRRGASCRCPPFAQQFARVNIQGRGNLAQHDLARAARLMLNVLQRLSVTADLAGQIRQCQAALDPQFPDGAAVLANGVRWSHTHRLGVKWSRVKPFHQTVFKPSLCHTERESTGVKWSQGSMGKRFAP